MYRLSVQFTFRYYICSELRPRHSIRDQPSHIKLPLQQRQGIRHPHFGAKHMNASDIIFYTTPQGEVRIEVYFEDETF